MVHGDDNSSLPRMALVSRCLWCYGVLAFVCLLTQEGQLAFQTIAPNAPVLDAGDLAAPLCVLTEDAAPVLVRFQNAEHQPKPFRTAMFLRVSARSGKLREALSKALPGGPISAKAAGIETRHRLARPAGSQRPRGASFRGHDPEDGRHPFVAWEGFPPTVRFA